MTPDLAVIYEHPQWFAPLFATLDRRGVAYEKILLTDHDFDPHDFKPPAPVILSRVAMSSFLREREHPIFYAQALLDHWRKCGATVLNGSDVIAIDSSKARQLSLMSSLGLAVPKTRVVHRAADLERAALSFDYPLLVKANIGGSGAGIARYSSLDHLAQSVREHTVPDSIDNVLLIQDYVPPRGGVILRLETLGGRFLYALEVESGGNEFDLCPADACLARPGRASIGMRSIMPPHDIIDAAQRIAAAVGMDVGGIEVVIDDRDGTPRFYDINALSNFVANPLEVLGWDPHDRLIDMIEAVIAGKVKQ